MYIYNSIGNISSRVGAERNYTWRPASIFYVDLGAKLSEYASLIRGTAKRSTGGDHRSQALTVMWRRIFRTTLSAACELTVQNSGLCFVPATRVLYHNNTTCPDAHVRAPESLAIISLCTQRDLLEAVEKCRCTYVILLLKHYKTILYYSSLSLFLLNYILNK